MMHFKRRPGQGPHWPLRGTRICANFFFSFLPSKKLLAAVLPKQFQLAGGNHERRSIKLGAAVFAQCGTIITITGIAGSKIYMRSTKVRTDTLLLLSIKSLITLSISCILILSAAAANGYI